MDIEELIELNRLLKKYKLKFWLSELEYEEANIVLTDIENTIKTKWENLEKH